MESETENPFGPSSDAEVKQIIADTNAKHLTTGEPAPKKRGRPFGWRKQPVEPVPAVAQVPATPPIDKELVKKSVSAICKTVDGILTRNIYANSMIYTKGDKEFSTKLAQNAGMSVDELELISGLSAEICAKYNVLATYAAEILLAVAVTGYSCRSIYAFSQLRELKKLRDKHESQAQTN